MSERVVVILVPGIFASHLVNPNGDLAWPVNKTAKMAGHLVFSPTVQREAFKQGGNFEVRGPVPPPGTAAGDASADAGWQNVALEFYRPFLRACQDAGKPGANPRLGFTPLVFAIGYNFALSNSVSSFAYVVLETERILAANQLPTEPPLRVLFVTHSMGALVVRDALRTNTALRNRCICVIHVAAPNAGAPESLMRFIRGSKDTDPFVKFSFGNRGWKCIASASTVLSGFQLLPYPMLEPQHRGVFGKVIDTAGAATVLSTDPCFVPEILDTQFADSASFEVQVVDAGTTSLPDRRSIPDPFDFFRWKTAKGQLTDIRQDVLTELRAARAFHRDLGDYIFPRTGAVVLTGKRTVERVVLEFDSHGLMTKATETLGDGDGTVPVASQRHLIRGAFALGHEGSTAQPFVEMHNVEHADALGLKGVAAFPQILTLMNLFYRVAPAPQAVAAGASQT